MEDPAEYSVKHQALAGVFSKKKNSKTNLLGATLFKTKRNSWNLNVPEKHAKSSNHWSNT